MQLLKHFTANNVKIKRYPFVRELSMEAYLIENEGILILDDENFSEIEIIDIELTIKSGRNSLKTDGRIDILALYNQQTYAVIELKLGEINEVHLQQLEDYIQERNQLAHKYIEKHNEIESNEDKWIGVIVGSSIDPILENTIKNGYLIQNSIPVAALTIDRFRGDDGQIYVLTETYFKNVSRSYDKTKYRFKSELLGKSRLVLKVVQQYVEDHPEISYPELKKVFPDKLQGTRLGVFDSSDSAAEIFQKSGHKRHFIRPEELLSLADTSTVAVCSQWGIDNISAFVEKARELGYQIDTVV